MRRFDVISDESQRGIVLGCVRGLLRSLSVVYGVLAWHRAWAYRIGLLRTRSLACYVVSVGNITIGGTGKTPLVMTLARQLTQRGLHVAILSRGYKGTSRGVCIVSDGHQVLVSRQRAGDEPYLLAQELHSVPVVVGRDRCAAGRLAVERFTPDIVLLDDGFQHLGVDRDLDVVVIDSTAPLGNRRLLPGGPLREPVSALKRADVFCLSRVDECSDLDGVRRRLASIQPRAPVVEASHRATRVRQLCGPREELGKETLEGKSVFALSGIGKPASFHKTLEKLRCRIVGGLSFPDHHPYSAADLNRIEERSRGLGAEYIVTTAKDAVRLPPSWRPDVPVLVCEVELAAEGLDQLVERIVSGVEAVGPGVPSGRTET